MSDMKQLTLRTYVETIVWSFAFAHDSPDYTRATLDFFDECRAGRVLPVISPVVVKEVMRADDPIRSRLLQLIDEIGPEITPTEPAMDALAEAFILHGVVPRSKPDDAAHVASAFVTDCEVLVSWNFKHITNVRRAERFNGVALMLGYTRPLRIVTPAEVLYGDEPA